MKISRSLFWWMLVALLAAAVVFVWVDRARVGETRVAPGANDVAGADGQADQQVGVAAPDVDVAAMDCPTPFAGQHHPAVPLQGAVDALPPTFTLAAGTAKPLAAFAVEGRVLGRKHYRDDREARFAPEDIAFGWSRMRDPSVLAKLNITQSNRWYHYNWTGEPPIPVAEIVESSANMHMIPANARIAEAIADIERDDIVRVDGFLVSVSDGQGWGWHSSMTRGDSGAGACEVVYVCRVQVTRAR